MAEHDPNLCLIGKVLSHHRHLGKSGVISIVKGAWLTKEPFKVHHWDQNHFLFIFKNRTDVKKIVDESPWSVMGYYLALVPWNPDKTLEEINFNRGLQLNRPFLCFRVEVDLSVPLCPGIELHRDGLKPLFSPTTIDSCPVPSPKIGDDTSQVVVANTNPSVSVKQPRPYTWSLNKQALSNIALENLNDLIDVTIEYISTDLPNVKLAGVVASLE
ncbi:retrotransposon protein, putative, unclassified [Tanacetum coccineum]